MNLSISDALGTGQTEFTEEEWGAFEVRNLRIEHYVASKGSYYVPAAVYNAVPVGSEAKGLTWKTRWRSFTSSASLS